ncbi:MAG: helix-turn-helix domain-containing protein [Candidatus Moranbacteria bacterium]|nr:helix-turn-helix domain-containing protein [Candidatus Moranbacteria bacterium]
MGTKNHQPEDLLSTAQVAEILGVSRFAVFQRIKRGSLLAKKIGRNYLIRYGDLIGDLSEKDKQRIEQAVKQAVEEYSETFKLLGKE